MQLKHIRFRIPLVFALLPLFGALVEAQNPRADPLVAIEGLGLVQGSIGYSAWTARPFNQFFNIKYAVAPIGPLRFLAPVRVSPWPGVMNASTPGRPCPQLGRLADVSLVEDCLSLSVFTHNTTDSRPVMVFIHGGGFSEGGASDYGPEYLLEKDIVLVVIQYRLGPLGFLSTGTANIPGNAGMLDMIMALEWVSQNIRFFGGDSSQVTVFGESAGGAAISALLYSPLVRETLFSRAIIQSGSIFSPWATCRSPKEGAIDIARRVGCDRPAESMEDCLRSVPAVSLMQAYNDHRIAQFNITSYADVAGACIVIGEASPFMPKHPKTFARNAISHVELIAGTTSQEGLLFWEAVYRYGLSYDPANMKTSWELFQLVETINDRFGSMSHDGSSTWYQLFNSYLTTEIDRANFTELLPALVDICGNLAIKAPVMQDVVRFAYANTDKVYLYSFDYSGTPSMYNFSASQDFQYPYPNSVFHAEDLFYLFPLGQRLNQQDTEMAKLMVELWTSFATRGVPTAPELTHSWDPVTHFNGPYLKINSQCENRNNYFNEFTASIDKARNDRSAATPRCVLSTSVLIVLTVFIKTIIA
ncbi:glutactin-like isoform X2 [Anopheles aquasalis]|uniref:glutactin-like isoform X2 n=1 Tax=Anopheles aquasalis TaxID=42839 RepID=UPI00215A3C5F|nr:glutactin-like isoform X2 [Anopheles aquasalis]